MYIAFIYTNKKQQIFYIVYTTKYNVNVRVFQIVYIRYPCGYHGYRPNHFHHKIRSIQIGSPYL